MNPLPGVFNYICYANASGYENLINFTQPVILKPHDDTDLIAGQGGTGGTGGIRVSYRPADGKSTTGEAESIHAGQFGACYIWTPGWWSIRITRWGDTSLPAENMAVPVRAIPFMEPLLYGYFGTNQYAEQAQYSGPTVQSTGTTIITLSNALKDLVAVSVTPTGTTSMNFRWGNTPSNNARTVVASGDTYIFQGNELPLAELRATVPSLPDAAICRVVRYTR